MNLKNKLGKGIKGSWCFIVSIGIISLFVAMGFDSFTTGFHMSWTKYYSYGIDVILTVDSIMTGASVSFLVFSYFSNSSTLDKLKTKILWKNNWSVISKEIEGVGGLNKRNNYSFWKLSPVAAISCSIFATLLEVIAFLFDLYITAIICELITILLTLSILWRFNSVRKFEKWNILRFLLENKKIISQSDITYKLIEKKIPDEKGRIDFQNLFLGDDMYKLLVNTKESLGDGKLENGVQLPLESNDKISNQINQNLNKNKEG